MRKYIPTYGKTTSHLSIVAHSYNVLCLFVDMDATL